MNFISRLTNEQHVEFLDPREQYTSAATESEKSWVFFLRWEHCWIPEDKVGEGSQTSGQGSPWLPPTAQASFHLDRSCSPFRRFRPLVSFRKRSREAPRTSSSRHTFQRRTNVNISQRLDQLCALRHETNPVQNASGVPYSDALPPSLTLKKQNEYARQSKKRLHRAPGLSVSGPLADQIFQSSATPSAGCVGTTTMPSGNPSVHHGKMRTVVTFRQSTADGVVSLDTSSRTTKPSAASTNAQKLPVTY